MLSGRSIGITLAALAFLAGAPGGHADDRDLLKSSIGEPYVFIILDTSESMNWSTPCSAAQLAAGDCRQLCTTRDCFVPRSGDDPASKIYQAKEVLSEVLEEVENIRFGFASFNQDQLRVLSKHWLYAAAEPGPSIPGYGAFPARGEVDVFGRHWACKSGTGDAEVGCAAATPADLDDPWERQRVARFPKGDTGFDESQQFWVRTGGKVYRVVYTPTDDTLGDSDIEVRVEIFECAAGVCVKPLAEKEVRFRRDQAGLGPFVSWDLGPARAAPGDGFFNQGVAADARREPANGNDCAGWDPNDDSNTDRFGGYNLRAKTEVDPRGNLFSRGDVLPLDWLDDNKGAVLERLAPAAGEYGIASYFEDSPRNNGSPLRLNGDTSNEEPPTRPLIAVGRGDLGNAISDFRTWWAGCPKGSCQKGSGWADIAAANDPDWACRRKYLLVITDGDIDTSCKGPNPCSDTASLFAQEAIQTYVVGFGAEKAPGNVLHCMAANGGSGSPIYPQTRQELIDALREIFGEIEEASRSFASAAVPSVQAEVTDKIYLSSFTPLNEESVWDGHLDAFLKPLPLTDNGRPDKSRDCASLPAAERSRCHLWDAGEVLLGQAPVAADLTAGDLRLGPAANQRRIFFPQAPAGDAIPRARALLRTPDHDAFSDPFTTPYPSDDEAWMDLFDGLGLGYDPADDSGWPKAEARQIVETTLVVKSAVVDNPDGSTTPVTYVLGDIFHSNPKVIDRPTDFRAFAANYYTDGTDAGGVTCRDSNPGYRCFAKKHERRRKMLVVGANDGMLHFFDAGVYNPGTEKFSNGTGKETLAFIPRLTLPIVAELARDDRQIFGVDSSPRVVDVFIDPKHTGEPTAADRRWRTLLMSGLREGGSRDGGGSVRLDNDRPFSSGYLALDITQPDRLSSDNEPINQNVVPTCITQYDPDDCGVVPFGSALWEFTDSEGGSPAEGGTPFDEDLNGAADLGDTWSVPVLGRIRTLDDAGDPTDRFVAIFGGGFDPRQRSNPRRGSWLYIVDVETGKAIYKRPLQGAAPSTPAAVDRNRDGYIDWVYIGTTAGLLYKVDISTPVAVSRVLTPLLDPSGSPRFVPVDRVTDIAWDPFPIFDTGARPIFFPPTVLNLAAINRFALAFGTGDRELLWALDGAEGRFFMLVDEMFTRTSSGLPRTESDYEAFDSQSSGHPGSDFVLNPASGRERGWVMTLEADERVVAQAFSVSGVTIFPTFKGQVIAEGGSQGGGQGGGRNEEPATCARTGDSRVFVVFSHNGDPILPSESGGAAPDLRYMMVGEALVTPPFADRSTTKNPDDGAASNADQEAWRTAITSTLKGLFPPRTRFANYSIDVSFIRSDTGVVGPIPIPVGIIEKNWKEF